MLPLVVTVESPDGKTRRYAFADSPVRVGRSPFAELQLTEAFVSRWEGTLRFDDHEVTYFHVSQTNPTYVDGRPAGVHEEVAIDTSTVLTLGELKLRFTREPVRDEDLRRKGKRRPIKADDDSVAKTVWLDAGRALAQQSPQRTSEPAPRASEPEAGPRHGRPPERAASSPPPAYPFEPAPAAPSQPPAYTPPSEHPVYTPSPEQAAYSPPPYAKRQERPSGQPPQPVTSPPWSEPPPAPSRHSPPGRDSALPARAPSVRPAADNSVRVAREVRVLPSRSISTPPPAPRSEPPSVSSRPGVSEHVQAIVRPKGGFAAPPADAPSYAPSPGSGDQPKYSPPAPTDLDALHAEYRSAFAGLLSGLAAALARVPEAQRAAVADQFQRRYPQISQEPDYRALLGQFGLEAQFRLEAPGAEATGLTDTGLTEWLRGIAQGMLPSKFRADPSRILERVLSLLEMLTQSFAEINDAQDNIRRHWLGRAPRSSLLRSDNGRAILAYLLHPQADFNDRLAELENAISDVIMHELSLFKATLEGARSMIEALSPQALAKAEGIDLESLEEGSSGFLGRLLPRDTPEARLWRRFAETYEGLMDGDRYQRVFLGRKFARTYLAAMGQRDTAPSGDDK